MLLRKYNQIFFGKLKKDLVLVEEGKKEKKTKQKHKSQKANTFEKSNLKDVWQQFQ